MGRSGQGPKLVAVFAIVAIASGCSFMFSSAPRGPRDSDCSTSQAPPVLDSLFAVLQLIRVAIALDASNSDYHDAPISREADVGFGVGFVFLHGLSARYGFSAASRCSAVRESSRARLDKSRSPRRRRVVPKGGLGFSFGMTPTQARDECEQAGMTWSETSSGYVCSGAVHAVGDRTASIQLRFCQRWLCRVELTVRPDSGNARAFATLFGELRRAFTRTHGDPNDYAIELPEECKTASEFLECVSKGRAHGLVRWRWPSGHVIRLDLMAAPGGAPIVQARIVHPTGRTHADGLAGAHEADSTRAPVPTTGSDEPSDAGAGSADAGIDEDASGATDS